MIGELEAAAADFFRDLIKPRRNKHPAPVGQPCANCDTPLQGQYCYACGQNSDQHKRSILHLSWEATEGIFDFDGRLWRTVPALFFRPGRLAHDYIEGRAARHVPPFRAFLVSLLLLIFAAEHAVGTIRKDADAKERVRTAQLATPQGRARAAAELQLEAAKDRADGFREALGDRADDLKDADSWRERRRVEGQYLHALAHTQATYEKQLAKADQITAGQGDIIEGGSLFGSSEARRKAMADQVRKGDFISDTGGKKSDSAWFKEGLAKAIQNPDYYLTVMFDWAHRIAVLLLPIVGLSLAAVYFYKRKFYLYDHLLVAMNLLSFVFLTNALGLILPMKVWPWWFGLLSIWTPINLFQTLRGPYGSSIVGAVVKTLVVWFMTFLAFSILLTGLLVFTLSQV
jgi:hypothetical protein